MRAYRIWNWTLGLVLLKKTIGELLPYTDMKQEPRQNVYWTWENKNTVCFLLVVRRCCSECSGWPQRKKTEKLQHPPLVPRMYRHQEESDLGKAPNSACHKAWESTRTISIHNKLWFTYDYCDIFILYILLLLDHESDDWPWNLWLLLLDHKNDDWLWLILVYANHGLQYWLLDPILLYCSGLIGTATQTTT